ncbi:MAG: DUF1460 domain-containing protein [Deltaproteobacteria bacterium]|nr:DUF1460 domain-containing protein [Deltaproteobacteria bacterium]
MRWARDARRLLDRVAFERDAGARAERIATACLGLPYVSGPLRGGPEEEEQLVVDLRAFDCVTFVESVLALARSRSVEGFLREIRQTRYRDGCVDWSRRLHYFSDWMRSNEHRGALRIRTRGRGSRSIEARLAFIEALPAHRVRFHVVPKSALQLARPRISAGSVIAFASLRSKLDFFHTGLLRIDRADGRGAEGLTLVHASRSAGEVRAEPLDAFLKRNRMRGIAFASLLDGGGR